MKKFVGEVSHDRWLNAQYHELATWKAEPVDGEDWNSWWASAFDNYSFVREQKIDSILEVGCGPYAKNLELFVRSIGYTPSRIILEDPLLEQYIQMGKSIRRFVNKENVTLISMQMENVNLPELKLEQVDVVLCNNVLDHVESVSRCFEQMWNALKVGGILVFGQDLADETDLENRDIKAFKEGCHPIMINEAYMEPYLSRYELVYRKTHTRENSRNPDANCGTLMFAGRKQ